MIRKILPALAAFGLLPALVAVATSASARGVMVYAWPASWPGRQSLHSGEEDPMRLVGQAISTTTGAFAVRVGSPAVLGASAGRGGLINLQAGAAGAAGSDQ